MVVQKTSALNGHRRNVNQYFSIYLFKVFFFAYVDVCGVVAEVFFGFVCLV